MSLSLANVRCFGPKQTLDLSDGNGKPARWTIILGLNGTGKTTLLQALVGFELRSMPHKRVDQKNRPRFFDFPPDMPLSILRNGPCKFEVEITTSRNLSAIPVNTSILETEVLRPGAMTFRPIHFDKAVPCCIAYGASRRVGSATLSETEVTCDPTATLFSDNARLRDAEEWLLRLDYAAAKQSTIQSRQKDRLEQVKHLLLSILPDIDEIRLTTPSGTHPNARAEFKTPYGWVPLRQLGYGYQTLITWVADFANRMVERYPDSPDPLSEPAVVLVDEIDLHLHPVWQRKLMGFLTERFPNTQFIATAHSPLVAQAAADANLAVLRREGDHVVIDNDVDNIRGWRIDQILTSDLFGLESARPPETERLLVERKALLTKSKPTAADKQRLAKLEDELGELPTGETAQEVKEREEIRKSMDLLTKDRRAR